MKRLLQLFASFLLVVASASAQTNVVVTPQTANPGAVSIGVTFTLGSEWQITSTPFEKTSNSAGVPVWSLNTVAVRSINAGGTTTRNVTLNYAIGAVAPGTTGRILWKFNGQTLKESTLTIPPSTTGEIGAGAVLTVTPSATITTVRVKLDFKEYAAITAQKAPVKDGTRFIIEATATRVPVAQILPPPPLPSFDLNYSLGAVPAGAYTAVFKLNGTTLAEQPFTVVGLPNTGGATVSATFEPTTTGTIAKVRIVLQDPYYELREPGTPVTAGNLVKINATLVRIETLVALPSPKIIEHSYPLGMLPAGTYSFQYSINNSLKLTRTFSVAGPPAAPLQLAFVEAKPASDGNGHVAEVGVIISDPALTVTDWGTATRTGNKFTATLTTGPRPTTDPGLPAGLDGADGELANNPLIQAQAFVASPGNAAAGAVPVRIERFRYAVGTLATGSYEFEILSGGRSVGLRQFTIRPTPPPPGPVVAAIEIFKTSTGSWSATVRMVLPPGRTVTQWGEPKQEGNQFKVSLTTGPALTAAADAANGVVVRPLESFTYPLGTLTEGTYSFAVLEGENQLAVRPFVVAGTPPPPVVQQPRLAFIDIKRGDASTAAEVGVMLPQPGVSITSWGEITRVGNQLKATLDIKVDAVVPAVVLPPKLERHVYSLGVLGAGEYKLTICYKTATNTEPRVLGARAFEMGTPPPPPPVDPQPIIAFLVDGVNEQGSFIDLGLAWPFPGHQVTDWGTPVREGNGFSTTLVTGKAQPPATGGDNGVAAAGISLLPADGNVTDDMVAPVREIGGWPTGLVRHRYLLGLLPAGEYQFSVGVAGKVLARRAFTVREIRLPLPFVTTTAEPVRRAGTAPAPFTLSFNARAGWPADPTLASVTVKGPGNFTATATRRSGGIISLDPLGMLAKGEYEWTPPGGTWDVADNGIYQVFIDPSLVKDRQDRSPINPVGRILVQILPTPPLPPPGLKAEVTVAMTDGQWTADVSFENTGGWWEANWGRVMPRGPVFFAEARLAAPPAGSRPAIPASFQHRYLLGELKPGSYSFAFRSSAGHIGHAVISVPGVEPPTPFEAWKFNAFAENAWNPALSDDSVDGDDDGQSTLAEYALGGHPRQPDRPDYRAEIVTGPSGEAHLALQYRRALGSEKSVATIVEMSSNMRDWVPAGQQVDLVIGAPDADGTQPVTARQTALLSASPYPYLRLRFEKTAD